MGGGGDGGGEVVKSVTAIQTLVCESVKPPDSLKGPLGKEYVATVKGILSQDIIFSKPCPKCFFCARIEIEQRL